MLLFVCILPSLSFSLCLCNYYLQCKRYIFALGSTKTPVRVVMYNWITANEFAINSLPKG